MEVSERQLLYLFLTIVVTSLISMLPFRVRTRRSWIIYAPSIPWSVYVVYEYVMQTQYPQMNIRIDLLIIWPLLFFAIARSWQRWENQARP